jgi:hypothetical protein
MHSRTSSASHPPQFRKRLVNYGDDGNDDDEGDDDDDDALFAIVKNKQAKVEAFVS